MHLHDLRSQLAKLWNERVALGDVDPDRPIRQEPIPIQYDVHEWCEVPVQVLGWFSQVEFLIRQHLLGHIWIVPVKGKVENTD